MQLVIPLLYINEMCLTLNSTIIKYILKSVNKLKDLILPDVFLTLNQGGIWKKKTLV